MPWHTEFANEEYVQGDLQPRGNFVSDRDAPSRQPQNDHIRPIPIIRQALGELTAGVDSVPEAPLMCSDNHIDSCLSFRLQRFHVIQDVRDANGARAIVGIQRSKDRTPHGHVSGAVCGNRTRLVAGEIPLDVGPWK
jgi:hypothetical protein